MTPDTMQMGIVILLLAGMTRLKSSSQASMILIATVLFFGRVCNGQ